MVAPFRLFLVTLIVGVVALPASAQEPVACTGNKGGILRCGSEVIEGFWAGNNGDGTYNRLAWYEYFGDEKHWRQTALYGTGQMHFVVERGTSSAKDWWTFSHYGFPRSQALTIAKFPGQLRFRLVDAGGVVWMLSGSPLTASRTSVVIDSIGGKARKPVAPAKTEAGVMGINLKGTGIFYLQHVRPDFSAYTNYQAPKYLKMKSVFHDRRGKRCSVRNRDLFDAMPNPNDVTDHVFKLDTDAKAIDFLAKRCRKLDLEPLRQAIRPKPVQKAPPPDAPPQSATSDLNRDVLEVAEYLGSPDPARRIAGCKLARGKVNVHGVKRWSGAVTALLVARLADREAEVRRWAAIALRFLDRRSLPDLRAALAREQDPSVQNQLQAVIRQFEQAEAQEATLNNHPCHRKSLEEIATWPVRELCDSLGRYPRVLFGLADGTSVYMTNAQECFRGRRAKRCFKKCLPASTAIDTPDGRVRVDALRVGDTVWSVDDTGRRIVVPILKVGSVSVNPGHRVVRVLLSDGRALEASANHPTARGDLLGDVGVGDRLDGATVVKARRVEFAGDRTYDILPGGPTGYYFAEGVLVGSSLDGRR